MDGRQALIFRRICFVEGTGLGFVVLCVRVFGFCFALFVMKEIKSSTSYI